MRYKYAFLLGRPGCGKSAFYRELERQVFESDRAATIERVDDFPKLWARFRADDTLEEEGKQRIYVKRIAEGHYEVIDEAAFEVLLDIALQEVNADVLQRHRPNHLIVVEFSRSSYVKAMQFFDPGILDHCLAVYMEVSFDLCWVRNLARHEAAIADSVDDHLVPREVMEKRYLHDDQDAFVQHMKDQDIPVLVVNNEAEGEEHLERQVAELFKDLF
jgi:tRNA uridine 5-carbamoylmethylation protein Kti12